MQNVVIYTKLMCPYCIRALNLLKEKGAPMEEIRAGFDKAKTAEMVERANGARTYPQIFIGAVHVGGADELYALEKAGKLDALLAVD